MKIKKWLKEHKKGDYFPVGEGWRPLVEQLCGDIIAIDKRMEVVQVKEKFGGLRFYVSDVAVKYFDEIYKLIGKAEDESFKTCEDCGGGDVTTEGGWVKTLCKSCRGTHER